MSGKKTRELTANQRKLVDGIADGKTQHKAAQFRLLWERTR